MEKKEKNYANAFQDAFAKRTEDALWEHLIARELERQHGPAAAPEIMGALRARGMIGQDFNFVFLKVMEVESSKNKNPEYYVGSLETWRHLINNYDSWKEDLDRFRFSQCKAALRGD